MKKEDRILAPELSELTVDDLLDKDRLPVNGSYTPDDDDTEEEEDDLVLGDEDEIEGNEEEYEVDLEDDVSGNEVTEKDLVLDTEDDSNDDDDDDDDL